MTSSMQQSTPPPTIFSKDYNWLTLSPDELIKRAQENKYQYRAALDTVDMATPTLNRFGEYFLSEEKDYKVYLYFLYNKEENKLCTSIIKLDEKGHSTVLHQLFDKEQCRLLTAAFCHDFPFAVFSNEEKLPLRVFITEKNGHVWRRNVCQNTTVECYTHKWTDLKVAVPTRKMASGSLKNAGYSNIPEPSTKPAPANCRTDNNNN